MAAFDLGLLATWPGGSLDGLAGLQLSHLVRVKACANVLLTYWASLQHCECGSQELQARMPGIKLQYNRAGATS